MRRGRWAVPALALALAALLVGCGSSTTAGSAVAAGSPAVAFDPCTQVTDTIMASVGLDPATKKPYNAKGSSSETGCSWKDAPTITRLRVDVGVNHTQIDKYLTNLGVKTMTELSIGGRRVVNFVTDTAGGGCNLAIDLGSAIGIVATSAFSQTSAPDPDSCPDAERIAGAISPVLP